MQSRSILFLVIVLALGVGSGFLLKYKKVSYGLDTRGGIRLTYRMDVEHMTPEQRRIMPKIQNDLVRIIENRATGNLGVTEPSVARKGEDAFVVELPGLTDINQARSVMSTTAKIIVYWAKNVSTAQYPNRRYQSAGNQAIGDVEYAVFSRTTDPGKVIDAKDPEYAEMIEGWEPILEGEEVSDARMLIVGTDARPEFNFNPSGAAKIEKWSRTYNGKGENIAFVLDNRVLSIAPVKEGSEGILRDSAQIDGRFPVKYVKNLTDLIKAGSLPVSLIELSSEQVDPTIGSHALDDMVKAGVISMGIVCLLLVVYYRWPGFIAAIAMMLYALFTLAFMVGISATFSLAAIAAFILSVGMAVDANILVFERLKEELRDGKELGRATTVAFNRALTAIVDSNACTMMTCAVLWFFGTGPVKGFASTLGIGVAISFFTAFVVTRTLLQGTMALGIGRNPKWYTAGAGWFKGKQTEETEEEITGKTKSHLLNIVGRSKFYFILSALLILPGFLFLGEIKLNVEFQGGYEGTYSVPAGMTAETIRTNLEQAGILGSNVKLAEIGGKKVAYVVVPPIKDMSVSDPKAKEKIANAAKLPLENSSFYAIGPTVQRETVENAIKGVLLASLLIMIYLGFRFGITVGGIKNGLKFGASAVIALVHDVMFVIGMAGIVGHFLHWEISALFITAMLTVIGFSVHDTIIIFDRVRENLRRQHKGETFEHLCDHSVTQSVARSINTSMSAIIPLGILIAIGTPTPELKFMCLSMLLGIAIGAYSSIFNATPILYLWNKAVIKKKGEQAGLMAEAARETKLRAQMAAAGPSNVGPGAPAAPAAPASPTGGAYGQVKRRSSAVEQSKQAIDEEQE